MPEININKSYELYQIITDFTDSLETFREGFQNAIDGNADKVFCRVYERGKLGGSELVIDIWNNGDGLERDKVSCFFDLANSSKIDKKRVPIKGKLGYKGHGSKIFFNSETVQISSKTKDDCWAVELKNPIGQIEEKGNIEYSDFINNPKELDLCLPNDWDKGFWVRIVGHSHFKTEHTKIKLNHKNLRDYCKWYTVFGTIYTMFDKELKNKNIKLYLAGLDVNGFEKECNSDKLIDPKLVFETIDDIKYEVIGLGHYFPPQRYKIPEMKAYAEKIKSTKSYYEYYSRMFHGIVTCSNNTTFKYIISIEGYETKRMYDLLLTRGNSKTKIKHTDSERYGIWACKGGVPVEKVDNWIEGGKGVYSFMQVFIDCDDFQLTANRSSIHNSDMEKLDIVKEEVNKIFDKKDEKEAIEKRLEFKRLESQSVSVKEDEKNLRNRFRDANRKKDIILPNGVILKEPSKGKTGYSESETLVLFIQLVSQYPDLFEFKMLDYNTSKGMDSVIEVLEFPKYMEMKGTMHKKINHPFKYIYKIICYDMDFKGEDILSDLEDIEMKLKINRNDKFSSNNKDFKGKKYTSYQLVSESASIQNIEIINLKVFLTQVIGATIE